LTSSSTVTVFGAYGHTGRFIVTELVRQGFRPILSGRDLHRLKAAAASHGDVEVRAASIDDAASLELAMRGADAVINCAGPFAITAAPVIEAALRTRTPYLDIVAEPDIAEGICDRFAARADQAGVIVAPALAFFGGLGDLLATAAMGDWSEADEITLAFALSSWKPTLGTRATIEVAEERRGGKRLVLSNRRLELRADDAPTTEWTFPPPIGLQKVVAEFTTADSVTLSRHLKTAAVHEYMTLEALKDLSDPDKSPPPAVDAIGRSAQTFLVEAVARLGGSVRRAVARGRDIYAITAPLVVEGARRVISSQGQRRGLLTAGQLSDPRDFLGALSPQSLELAFD
jgi:NAD(P)-dependent dehydrogenase (short-subunit alcohol dehydrogenase family)